MWGQWWSEGGGGGGGVTLSSFKWRIAVAQNITACTVRVEGLELSGGVLCTSLFKGEEDGTTGWSSLNSLQSIFPRSFEDVLFHRIAFI